MQFDSISDFFNMGGYAFYVWLASFFCVSTLIITSARQKRKVLIEIAKKMNREERLKETRSNKS